jgi:hypothetical protein
MYKWLHNEADDPIINHFLYEVLPTIQTDQDNAGWQIDQFGLSKAYEIVAQILCSNGHPQSPTTSQHGELSTNAKLLLDAMKLSYKDEDPNNPVIPVKKILDLANLLLNWTDRFAPIKLTSQNWRKHLAQYTDEPLPRNTVHAFLYQLYQHIDYDNETRPNFRNLFQEVFLTSVIIRDFKLARKIAETTFKLSEEDSLHYFFASEGFFKLLVLEKSADKFVAILRNVLKNKSGQIIVGKQKYQSADLYTIIAGVARFVDYPALKQLHTKLDIKRLSITEFIFATEAGNIKLCKAMVDDGFPEFIDRYEILSSILIALSNVGGDQLVTKVGGDRELVTKVFDHVMAKSSTSLHIKPIDAIEILSTAMLSEDRKMMIFNRTKWSNVLDPDITRSYKLSNDLWLVQLLLDKDVLSKWSHYPLPPKFNVLSNAKSDVKAVEILRIFGLIF